MSIHRHSRHVVLVFPRFRYKSGDIPIGLATLAAYIREQVPGISVSVLDTTFAPSFAFVERYLQKHRPDIAGIFVDVLMAEDAAKVAAIAKKQGVAVIAGGPHATMAPEAVLKEAGFDAVCVGEGEDTFREYIEAFYGNRNFAAVRGLWFRQADGTLYKTPERGFIEDIDALPRPAFDLFDMERYIRIFIQMDSHDPALRGVSLTVSRGCPFHCTFCQPTVHRTLGRKVRIRSPQSVVADLAYLKGAYRIECFYLSDDLLTVLPDWIREFCSLLESRGLDLPWGCNTRVDTIDAGMMARMKRAGLVKLKVGIESITDRIRNGLYNKQITRLQITDTLAAAQRLGIQVTGFIMVGAPTETAAEVWDTIRFAATSSLDEMVLSVTTPFPGSALHDHVIKQGWRLPSRFRLYNYYQVRRPRMSDDQISNARLFVYKKAANAYFYLHPSRLATTIRSVVGGAWLRKLLIKLRRV
ncbi:MAG: radical SAM protein [Thermodesulfobacteriota bacterium]|nr:radical SAM protein [Thermodesulfobacteriota bacterium]